MALSIDTYNSGNANDLYYSVPIPFNTTKANDLIILLISSYSSGAYDNFSAFSDDSGVTSGWARVPGLSLPGETTWAGGFRTIDAWYTTASAAITGPDSGSANLSGTIASAPGASWVGIVAINGANLTSPFDSTGTVLNNPGSAGDPFNVTTSNANDLILACFAFSGVATPTNGSGWTQLPNGGDNGSYQLNEYQIVSSIQTNLSITTGNAGQSYMGLVISVQAALSGIPVWPFRH